MPSTPVRSAARPPRGCSAPRRFTSRAPGFYTTDYARKGAKKATADGGSSDSGAKESKDSKGSSGSDSDGKGGEGRSSDSSSKSSEKTASKSGSGE